MPLRAADLPLRYNCVDILERNLAERGDKKALFSKSRTMTFAQVSAEANQVGNALRAAGVREGTRVGLFETTSISLSTKPWFVPSTPR